jgi:hypothetical protein
MPEEVFVKLTFSRVWKEVEPEVVALFMVLTMNWIATGIEPSFGVEFIAPQHMSKFLITFVHILTGIALVVIGYRLVRDIIRLARG